MKSDFTQQDWKAAEKTAKKHINSNAMKIRPFILGSAIGILLPLASFAQSLDQDLAKLKLEYDDQSRAVLKPVVLRYAAKLESQRSAAIKRGDAQGALSIERILADLRESTQIDFPTSMAAPPPVAQELKTLIAGATWKRKSDGREMIFQADGSLVSNWGGRGRWKIVRPHWITIEWNNKLVEECDFDANFTKFMVNGKEVWQPKK